MSPDIARLLLPTVQDLSNEGPDSYLLGAVTGACDMLEKLGHLTEPEYCLITDMAGRDIGALLSTLEEGADALTIQATETGD